MAKGTPVLIKKTDHDQLGSDDDLLEQIMGTELTGLVVKGALSQARCEHATQRLLSHQLAGELGSPNQGMPGGELKTIGAAATPAFTAFSGPTLQDYQESARQTERWQEMIFGDQNTLSELSKIFERLNHGRPAHPPTLNGTSETWLPFNYRVLPQGIQIYAHHDQHYRLPIYEHLDQSYDRSVLLSWFVTLQAPKQGGRLAIYGLRSDDPNPPMLPTRFMDANALDREYYVERLTLDVGDLVIFNSGVHVHRVEPVVGEQSRVTLGGFLTVDQARTHAIFWS